MKPYLTTALWACIVVMPAPSNAQQSVTPRSQSEAAPTGATLAAAPSTSNQAGWTAAAMIDGQPIERRPPEKVDDKPAFREQTRAPYHASAAFQVTTLIDNLPAPWSLAWADCRSA